VLWLCGSVLCASVAGAGERSGEPDDAWRTAGLWDDGKAEFSIYEVTWMHHGVAYPGSAQLILVKEPWAPELDVKADRPRPDGFDVLKLVHTRDVRTGIYTFHQATNVFVRRDSGTVQKLLSVSSEACGISFARMVKGRLEAHSYFDGQPDVETAFEEGVFPEDGLPAMLRGYVRGKPPASLPVLPSLMTERLAELAPRILQLSRTNVKRVETPAGTFPGVAFRLSNGNNWLTYTFAEDAPFLLLRLERSDGTIYRLAKTERLAYWKMGQPGDEAWIPERLR
jgi:hypothetical protein